MSSDKEIRKIMRMLQGLNSESSNNENKKSRKRKGKGKGKKQESSNESSSNDSSSNNNVAWYGRVPGASAKASGTAGKASGASASGAAGKASGASASGAAGKASGASASGASNANEKLSAAFTLYGTTAKELKIKGVKGKKEIEKTFRDKALKFHPDKATANEDEFKKWSGAKDLIFIEMGWMNKNEVRVGGKRKTRKN